MGSLHAGASAAESTGRQHAIMGGVPWTAHPVAGGRDPALDVLTEILDPVLVPLGFAPGQVGVNGGRAQVVFCRGEAHSADGGCVDLVVDVEAAPGWRVVDVRYGGYTADRWHLAFDRDAALADQVALLASTLRAQLPG